MTKARDLANALIALSATDLTPTVRKTISHPNRK
jgi:hypothetical protein